MFKIAVFMFLGVFCSCFNNGNLYFPPGPIIRYDAGGSDAGRLQNLDMPYGNGICSIPDAGVYGRSGDRTQCCGQVPLTPFEIDAGDTWAFLFCIGGGHCCVTPDGGTVDYPNDGGEYPCCPPYTNCTLAGCIPWPGYGDGG